jgi:hypothetical protein
VRHADLERGLVAGNRELPGACAVRSTDRETSSKNSHGIEDGGSEENRGKSFERETQRPQQPENENQRGHSNSRKKLVVKAKLEDSLSDLQDKTRQKNEELN